MESILKALSDRIDALEEKAKKINHDMNNVKTAYFNKAELSEARIELDKVKLDNALVVFKDAYGKIMIMEIKLEKIVSHLANNGIFI
jgi:uncharacterized protein YicC (UPF0701 family)